MNALLLLAPLSLFLETGLPIGLFVPGGDTLLLALGALAAEGGLEAFPLLPLLFLGSFLGHLLGYALGRYGGKALRRRFPEVTDVVVDFVWDPPWTPERMSESARGFFNWK